MFNKNTRALLDILAINHSIDVFYYDEQGYSVLHNSHEIAHVELDGKQYFSDLELLDGVNSIGYAAFRNILCSKYAGDELTRNLTLLANNWASIID